VAALLENLSGSDVASAPLGTSFLELGFDSLFLTRRAKPSKPDSMPPSAFAR
jgi:hypothetical protein